jgi:hypothetical protein
MAVHDMCADIAALLNPMPDRTDDEDDDAYGAMAEATSQEREDLAEALRMSWDEGNADPLLTTLGRLREQRLQLEADTRLLIAYGRCFSQPRPAPRRDLAAAAGMSISGVRTAYDTDEIDQAVGILQRPPAPTVQAVGDGAHANPAR